MDFLKIATKVAKDPLVVPRYLDFKYNNGEITERIVYRDFQSVNPNSRFKEEIEGQSEQIYTKLDDKFQEMDSKYSHGAIRWERAWKLYSIVRENKPTVVVETGVCNGVSTAFVLKALEENGQGKLYSIDLPEYEDEEDDLWEGKGTAVVPKGKEPGWVVPENLRERWELTIGDSNYRLPELLEEMQSLDMFIHDSEHSYQTMMLEMSLAWRTLGEEGIMVIDDFYLNEAFDHFAQGQCIEKFKIGDYGLLFKNSEGWK